MKSWFESTFDEPTPIQTDAWPEIKKRRNTLIAAPTGSGKTLAAFLAAIDDLIRQGLDGELPEATQVLYVSPLKALGNDIERNLKIPLRGIRQELKTAGLPDVPVKVAVRSGDTPASRRTAMVKHPPHILVTTPESLYLLLTSVNGRKLLSTVNTLIVDEIHAVVGNKRGSHLALSMERLHKLTGRRLVRIGLSATQKPIEAVADFLTGVHPADQNGGPRCSIIDKGHRRALDLDIEIPKSPLTAVMSLEVWTEIHARLEELIHEHDTTLIFVNTRRLAERLAHHLSEKLGPDVVTAHHGSMSKEHRLEAEQQLKNGKLKALIATASLELGIDIGSVDLVCQISSPRSIAAVLQRVGRSGHSVGGTPKGRLFPLTRDELVECAAIFDAVRRGELDRIVMPEQPLDILAQQIVAEVANDDYDEEVLFRLFTSAYPYRNLSRSTFDEVIRMLSEGFATRRGRRSAYLHHDVVNEKIRPRKSARLAALMAGGAIPDQFDFDVLLEPTGTFIGTLNEDFAIESMPGDIFQLANRSWQILRVENGRVRVQDAGGQPPTIPFWLGEAPGRSVELSESVSRLRQEISDRLEPLLDPKAGQNGGTESSAEDAWKSAAIEWVKKEVGLSDAAADQLVTYLGTGELALGAMPTQDTIVLERFFDDAGDMHVVIHAPFGNRLNRAWGLALRKRFCRKFNFELQAAATDDAIVLSLGATHSFSLEEVFSYLDPKTVRNVLIQAMLDAPMFEVRWRWNASAALAILRRRGGKRVAPMLQRIQAEDLIALIFPDQLACLENVVGERDVPEHPLVDQTIHDCLYEAMDVEGLESLTARIRAGSLRTVACDLKEPSPLAHEILNARPYAFLDDAPLEERRTRAISNRRYLDPKDATDLGNLDSAAIAEVQREAWPQVQNPDELHDALALFGFLTESEGRFGDGGEGWTAHMNELRASGRATVFRSDANGVAFWVSIERLELLRRLYPDASLDPELKVPPRLTARETSDESGGPLMKVLRSRLEALGPVSISAIAKSMGFEKNAIEQALIGLEQDGFVLKGRFTPGMPETEWCERRLLQRIHRFTLTKLRKEIDPVSAADYMRFLFHWHRLVPGEQGEGPESLRAALERLEGFDAPAAAWESDLLPSRVRDYDYQWLDGFCLSGSVVWGRFRPAPEGLDGGAGPAKSTPITLIRRSNRTLWERPCEVNLETLSHKAAVVLRVVREQGASFFDQIVEKTNLMPSEAENALQELVAKGIMTSDGFTGLRALLVPAKYKTQTRRRRKPLFSMSEAGRWSLLHGAPIETGSSDQSGLEQLARVLLARYGVVFRKLADRESFAPPWRELVRVFRRLEARGEIRGGRFVDGVWGEQYALPEAVTELRRIRNQKPEGSLVSVSAADPANLTGIITPGDRVSGLQGNRILYREGVPVAVKVGKSSSILRSSDENEEWTLRQNLLRQPISPKLRVYLGKGIG